MLHNSSHRAEIVFRVEPGNEAEYRAVSEAQLVGKTVRVCIGEPVCSRFREHPDKAPFLSEGQELWRLSLGFGVLPDAGCDIHWLRFGVALAPASNGLDEGAPILACGLFPSEIYEQRTFRRVFRMGSKLALEAVEISSGSEDEEDVVTYEPEIIAFGSGTAEPCWEFRAANRPVLGDKEVQLVFRRRPDMPVRCSLDVALEIRTKMGRVLPLKKQIEDAAVEEFVIE